jgi:hypothetical protein
MHWFIKDLDPVTPKAEQPLHHDSADYLWESIIGVQDTHPSMAFAYLGYASSERNLEQRRHHPTTVILIILIHGFNTHLR